jgi:acyl carrier protein
MVEEREFHEAPTAGWRAQDWTTVAELTRDPAGLGAHLGLAPEGSTRGTDKDAVVNVIQDVLGRPVSPSDNLYAMGVDSLQLVRIVARVRSRLGVDVPIAQLFHRADVADLVALVAQGTPQPEEDPAFLAQLGTLYDEEEEEDPPA